jgi:hypothetical protein
MATKSEKARRKRRYSNAKETMTAAEEGYRPTAFKVPEGVSIFRFSEEKVYRIDIIPFPAGKGNPRADEGCDHFERTFYVHRNLGPNQDSHCCLAKNFSKSCPVCEHRQRISNDPDGDQELADKLKPQWRHLWLVYDYDEQDKGVQLMDTAHYKSFGELLSNKVRAGDEDDNFENFHHLEDGMTLKVACEEDSFNGRTFFRPTNIEMKPRKAPLDASLTDDVPCLDDLLIELSYKKLKELLLAEPAEDEEEDEDKDSETSEDEDEEEEKPTKKPGKKTGKKPSKPADEDEQDESEDEDDEEETGDDDESEEEDEEEEGPKFKKGDNVKGEYRDKKFSGKVIAIKNGLVHVDTIKGNLRVMSPDELELVSRPKEEDEEGEEEKPKPKKPGKTSKPTSKKPSKKEEEEDDDDIWDEDDDEEEAEDEEEESEDEDED